jgi:predicted nucleotidyltransferase
MSIASFLFTPSVQRVLGITLLQPERSFTLQELLRVASSGRGSTQLQIDRLVEAGVLQDEPRRGNQRSIRANSSFPLYPELVSIARKSFALAEPIKEALVPFSAQIVEAFLFGSVAKGTDTEKSDVDLIIVGTASLFELTEIMLKVEQSVYRPIHFSLYEPEEWSALLQSDPIIVHIAHGEKIRLIPIS